MGCGGQLQPGDIDLQFQQGVDLAQHHLGIDHRAGTDQADGVRIEDPGGDQVQLEDPILNDDGVPGVDTALIADHDIGGPTQQIGDLAFPFVTPLRTDDDNIGQGHSGP